MAAGRSPGATVIAERLNAAMNAHDIEAFVACFGEDYESEQPAHPDRAFSGRDQVRENRSELLRATADRNTVWSEWRWHGTQLDMVGVIVFGVRQDRIAWARLYVEPVEQEGAGIDAAVRSMTGGE